MLESILRLRQIATTPTKVSNHNRFPAHKFLQGWTGFVHPRQLTWNLKIPPWKRRNIYKPPILGFHVNFRGCMSKETVTMAKKPKANAVGEKTHTVDTSIRLYQTGKVSPLRCTFFSGNVFCSSNCVTFKTRKKLRFASLDIRKLT